MRKSKKSVLSILSATAVCLTVGAVNAKWAVTDNAEPRDIRITVDGASIHTINYYVVNNEGNFTLNHTEYVFNGDTLDEVPTTEDIGNYTFEKWSTSAALSDSYDTSAAVTASVSLYSAYFNYFASTDATNYHELTKGSGNYGRFITPSSNDVTNFPYTYSLGETTFTGTTATIYKKYLGLSGYSSTSHSAPLIYGNSTTITNGRFFSIFYDGSTVIVNRRIWFELSQDDGDDYMGINVHRWQDGGAYCTNWDNGAPSGIRSHDDAYNHKFYYCDIETSIFNCLKVKTYSNYDGHYRESGNLYMLGNTDKDCIYLNSGGSGWMNRY